MWRPKILLANVSSAQLHNKNARFIRRIVTTLNICFVGHHEKDVTLHARKCDEANERMRVFA